MLFDLKTDPDELKDLGASRRYARHRARLYEVLARWSRTTRTQTTVSDAEITSGDEAMMHYDPNITPRILIGYWDEEELQAELGKKARFEARRRESP
jgi:hypothetical protein